MDATSNPFASYSATSAPTTTGTTGLDAIAFLAGNLIFLLILVVVSLVANWKIVSKAGYSGVFSLLLLVPIVNIIFYLIFAFKEWPIRKQSAPPPPAPAPAPVTPPAPQPQA